MRRLSPTEPRQKIIDTMLPIDKEVANEAAIKEVLDDEDATRPPTV